MDSATFMLRFVIFQKFDSPGYHLISLYGKEQHEQFANHLLLCTTEEELEWHYAE